MSCVSQSSGLKSADAVISALPAKLHAVEVLSDGTNAVTLVIYDNASAASGTVVAKIKLAGAGLYTDFTPTSAIICNNGIYADVTGTGAEFVIHYETN